jgi:hypothetical protein
MVGIKENDAVSTQGMLSEFLVILRGNMIDLEEQENDFNMRIFQHGDRETFANSWLAGKSTVSQVPRWFSFGSGQINIRKQIAIMKTVTGEA